MRTPTSLVRFLFLLHLVQRVSLSLAERLHEGSRSARRSEGCSLPQTPARTARLASTAYRARMEWSTCHLDGSSFARQRFGSFQAVASADGASLLLMDNDNYVQKILAVHRGGGTFRSNAQRDRRSPKRRSTQEEEEDAFDWDDAAEVLRSMSARTRIVWRNRLQPFLQNRVMPTLRGDHEVFGTDRRQSSQRQQPGANSGRPVAPNGSWGASMVAMQVGCLPHFILLSVAGYVVGDLLPSSSADDFELILGIAVRKGGRSQGDTNDSAFRILADWWKSVLHDPANAWKPLEKSSPRVQRAAGAALGILASRLLRPIVPTAIRVAVGAMVAGETNAFLCGEYGDDWYETHQNDNVDNWLRNLDDALERWRRIVRSAIQDPSRIYKRVRRTVDAQLQQRLHVPTHVANGVIGGVVVGLVVA